MELDNLLLFIDLTHKEEFSRLPLIQHTFEQSTSIVIHVKASSRRLRDKITSDNAAPVATIHTALSAPSVDVCPLILIDCLDISFKRGKTICRLLGIYNSVVNNAIKSFMVSKGQFYSYFSIMSPIPSLSRN